MRLEHEQGRPRGPGAALAAAACWWVPLFLMLVVLTIEGFATSPERLRFAVVAVDAVVLAAGFYLVYARRSKSRRYAGLWRFNAVMTWVVVAGLAAFVVTSPGGGAGPGPEVAGPIVSVKEGVGDAAIAAAPKRTLAVGGMVCQSCVKTVTEALLAVPGVLAADVDLEGASAVVAVDPLAAPSDSALVRAVVAAGYEAGPAVGAPGAKGKRP